MIEEVRKILVERLDSVWNNRTFIAFDNIDYYPKVGESFIRCVLNGVYAAPIALGCQREQYLFVVQILTPSIQGEGLNMQYSDVIATGFVGFSFGNLTIDRLISERVGTTKEWYQRNTLIDLHYDARY